MSEHTDISQLSWLDACDYDMIAKRTEVRPTITRIPQISIYFRFDSCAVPRLMSWADREGTSSLPAQVPERSFHCKTVLCLQTQVEISRRFCCQ